MKPVTVTRNGLPTRYAVEGMTHLCTDEVGLQRFEALKAEFADITAGDIGRRKELRERVRKLMDTLKHEGRLSRRDGEPLL